MFGLVDSDCWYDCAVMILLGAFVYRGHRWAIIGAMLLWTFEKLAAPLMGPPKSGVRPIIIGQLIWWAIYMHAFYLSLRVENERKRRQRRDANID